MTTSDDLDLIISADMSNYEFHCFFTTKLAFPFTPSFAYQSPSSTLEKPRKRQIVSSRVPAF